MTSQTVCSMTSQTVCSMTSQTVCSMTWQTECSITHNQLKNSHVYKFSTKTLNKYKYDKLRKKLF